MGMECVASDSVPSIWVLSVLSLLAGRPKIIDEIEISMKIIILARGRKGDLNLNG